MVWLLRDKPVGVPVFYMAEEGQYSFLYPEEKPMDNQKLLRFAEETYKKIAPEYHAKGYISGYGTYDDKRYFRCFVRYE